MQAIISITDQFQWFFFHFILSRELLRTPFVVCLRCFNDLRMNLFACSLVQLGQEQLYLLTKHAVLMKLLRWILNMGKSMLVWRQGVYARQFRVFSGGGGVLENFGRMGHAHPPWNPKKISVFTLTSVNGGSSASCRIRTLNSKLPRILYQLGDILLCKSTD